LQEYLQGKKIALPQYNVVATHGAAHNQEFEIECLVPKLEIQVFGTGGSRRAGEQAAAKLALEAVQKALVKTPSAARKAKPRTSQLKLAGIATIQPDAPVDTPDRMPVKPSAKAETKQDAKTGSKQDSKPEGTHTFEKSELNASGMKQISLTDELGASFAINKSKTA
jgi:ribonuclease-3